MPKTNVILITLESTRGDRPGFSNGLGKIQTPNMDQLAAESTVFKNAYTTGPVTPHSFPAILTSSYPLDWTDSPKIGPHRAFIGEAFRKAGYVTAAFHSSPFLSGFWGYNKGWDFFEDITPPDLIIRKNPKPRKTLLFYPKRAAKSILFRLSPELAFYSEFLLRRGKEEPAARQKIKAAFLNNLVKDFISSQKREQKPFFIWLHYIDMHEPYYPLRCYMDGEPLSEAKISYEELVAQKLVRHLPHYPYLRFVKFAKKYLSKTNELYNDAIKYVDQEMGSLLRFFKENNLYDNTVIAIAGDHGEEFFEHGGMGHSSKLYNELLHVPLLLRVPGRQPGVVDKKVSLIDLSPTLCELAKVDKPAEFKGGNLFNSSSVPVFHQSAQRTGKQPLDYLDILRRDQCRIACQFDKFKYILDYGSQKEELYDLSRDPGETVNIAAENKEEIQRARNIIKEFENKNPLLQNYDKSK